MIHNVVVICAQIMKTTVVPSTKQEGAGEQMGKAYEVRNGNDSSKLGGCRGIFGMVQSIVVVRRKMSQVRMVLHTCDCPCMIFAVIVLTIVIYSLRRKKPTTTTNGAPQSHPNGTTTASHNLAASRAAANARSPRPYLGPSICSRASRAPSSSTSCSSTFNRLPLKHSRYRCPWRHRLLNRMFDEHPSGCVFSQSVREGSK